MTNLVAKVCVESQLLGFEGTQLVARRVPYYISNTLEPLALSGMTMYTMEQHPD